MERQEKQMKNFAKNAKHPLSLSLWALFAQILAKMSFPQKLHAKNQKAIDPILRKTFN